MNKISDYRKYICWQTKYFFHCYTISGLWMLLLAAICISLGVPIIKGFNSFDTFYMISRFSFYYFALYTAVAFVMLRRAEEQHTEETLCAAHNGFPIYRISMFLTQLICMLAIQALFVLFILAAHLLHDDSNYISSIFVSTFFINIFLPMLICSCVAFLISFIKNRVTSYGSIIAFLLFLSPLDTFVFSNKPKLPIDKIWETIKWPFAILYKNSNWAADVQYGLQTELPRLQLEGAWIVLSIGLIVVLLVRQEKTLSRIKAASAGICIAAGICLFFISFQPACRYRLDERWDGNSYDMYKYHLLDDDYNNKNENKLTLEDLKEADYKISFYDMNVEAGRMLSVNGTFTITSKAPRKEFVFTLYDGYRVKTVKDKNNKNINYERKGDNLVIRFASPIKQADAVIEYEGYSSNYYSNSEGMMLPGYFPWYPMAGKKKIMLDYKDSVGSFGYNCYNRIPKAGVKLTVHSPLNIAANLNQTAAGTYEGETDGISLFAGNILPTQDEVIMTYLPLRTYKDLTKESLVAEKKETFLKALKTMEQLFGADVSEWKNKPVITPSADISRKFTNNYIAVFDDHIIAAEGNISSEDIISYQVVRNCKETFLIQRFLFSISDDSAKEIMDRLLEDIEFFAEGEKLSESEKVFKKNIEKARELLGDDELVKQIYKYATSKNGPQDDKEFFEQILSGEGIND